MALLAQEHNLLPEQRQFKETTGNVKNDWTKRIKCMEKAGWARKGPPVPVYQRQNQSSAEVHARERGPPDQCTNVPVYQTCTKVPEAEPELCRGACKGGPPDQCQLNRAHATQASSEKLTCVPHHGAGSPGQSLFYLKIILIRKLNIYKIWKNLKQSIKCRSAT